MKKALIASTALVLTAGVAAADVTISGYGRTGVIYYENSAADDDIGLNESRIVSRLRMDIDAATSTDQGVDFGARVRLQWDQGSGFDDIEGAFGEEFLPGNTVFSERGTQARLNAGKLWITASGLTVEIGNVDTAFDKAALLYGSELGAFDRSFGNSRGSFFSYNTGPYAIQQIDRVGVRAVYNIGDVNVQASYVDPDQSGFLGEALEEELGEDLALSEEFSIAASYTWNERLELSAAAVMDGAGIEDNDQYFVGARYAVMPNARVGLNWIDNGEVGTDDRGNTVTLYGDYDLADGLTNIEAYVANNSADGNETDNAFGIGVNYDLGGARLGASIHRDYDERVTADMGVRFDF